MNQYVVYQLLNRILIPREYVWLYCYNITDHLGNVRMVVDEVGTPLQVNHFDPFGNELDMSLASNLIGHDPVLAGTTDINPYKYGGKEWDASLSMYDFSARLYHPAIGRFTTMDPLCEKYYSVSPYAYCNNNPVNLVDPEGDSLIVSNVGTILYESGKDKGVYYAKDAGNYVYIGEIGNIINIDYIYANLLFDNMQSAKLMSPLKLRKLVKNHGEWDLKNNNKTIYGIANHSATIFEFNNMLLTSEDIGNHHFGAVTKSNVFITESFALEQAGAAQIAAGTSRPEWQIKAIVPFSIVSSSGSIFTGYTEVLLPPYGDDPNDQKWIKLGFEYANNHK